MKRQLLTAKAVENASVAIGERLLADGDNLFLRIRPGSKTWLFVYLRAGIRRKIGMGIYPDVSLASARVRADELRAQLADGIDPVEDRKRREAEERAEAATKRALPQTIRELFVLWERQELVRRKDEGAEVRRKFEKDVFPRIGDLPLGTVRRAHIMRIIDAVKGRGAPRVAGMLLSDLRQMFTWACDREIMSGDPTAGMKKGKLGGNARERDRVLGDAEIKSLMKALPGTLGEVQQHAVWIMLATCCRVGEVARSRWEHVDLDAATWTIPPENSKNGRPHTVNLSGFAVGQFKALRDIAEARSREAETKVSPWVMPARHHHEHVCPRSLAKQIGDRQRGEDATPMSRRSPDTGSLILPGGKWTPHDLRRTGATIMGMLGVRPDVIEKCLNHTEQNKIQRIYQRAELRPEMAEAWRLLGERIELLTRDDQNIVVMRKAAA